MELLLATRSTQFHSSSDYSIRKIDLSSSRRAHSKDAISENPVEGILFIAYGIVGPLIVSFGLIGNILILVVVGKSSMKGAIAVYLSALALSDIGALLSSIPLWVRLSKNYWCSYFSALYYAHAELFVLNTFMAWSIFNVVAMTIERYTSVCWVGKFLEMHTPQRAKMAIGISFIVALMISLPLVGLKITIEEPKTSSCPYGFAENKNITSHYTWTAYVWFGETCARILPALILATLNSLIIIRFRGVIQNRLRLSKPKTNSKRIANASAARHLEQERKLVTLLTSIIILFFVTNIPSAVLSIIYSQTLEDDPGFKIFQAVANLLEMANFAFNFIMYCFFSKEFRKMLREVFPCCTITFVVTDSTQTTNDSNRSRSGSSSRFTRQAVNES